MQPQANVSGHVWLYKGKRGSTWYAKWRRPMRDTDGTVRVDQVNERLGPAWTEKGRPPDGYFTRKTAEAALQAKLADARRGLGISTRTGATFEDAAEEWYRYGCQERDWKPATRRDYRSALNVHLIPAFGAERLEVVTPQAVERWRARAMADGRLPRRTAQKMVAILYAIFERARRVYGLQGNPIADVERLRVRYDASGYDFYSPQEVWALVRAAASEQDGAIYLTAAFTGMRLGELLALRVRDVDFEAEAIRILGSLDLREGVGSTKSGKGRTVPMVPEVAKVLAQQLGRDHFTNRDDPVFPNEAGGHLDGSALRRRYKDAQTRAKLRPLRFHDLRHTFGSLAITRGSTLQVQAWMGHADLRTTARYTHYKSRATEAAVLADAFRVPAAKAPRSSRPASRVK